MIDYHDGEGSCQIGKQKYRWEFHEFCGPTFFVNGSRNFWNPGEKHPVWDHFYKWMKRYQKARNKAKPHEIVKV